MNSEPVFVWRMDIREKEEFGQVGGAGLVTLESELLDYTCKYCGERLLHNTLLGDELHVFRREETICELCGWHEWNESFEDDAHDAWMRSEGEYILREFDIRSAELSLEELGSFLRRRFDKVLSISPRQLEYLVADVFKNQGYKVQITKSTRDGGFDIYILESNEGQAIVEVKRYKNAVGVDLVRQLRGVQLREGVHRAKLVTTSRFTKDAINEANASFPKKMGFALDLVNADDLIRMLSVYKRKTFSLKDLDLLRGKIRTKQDNRIL